MAHKPCMQLVRDSYVEACRQADEESHHHKWCNATQHIQAWRTGTLVERAVKNMIVGLAEYCDAYTKGNPEDHGYLGDDGYWGDYASDMCKALFALLNINIGRLNGGTLCSLIHAIAENAHIELEQ